MRLLIFFFVCSTSIGIAQQTYSTKSKKALKYFQESENYFIRRQYDQALDLLNLALDKDPTFSEAHHRKGLIAKNRKQYDKALTYFETALANNPGRLTPNLNYWAGEMNMKLGNYSEAKPYLENFLRIYGKRNDKVQMAEKYIIDCDYALSNPENLFEFDPQPLPDVVNAYALQYFPVLTADNDQLIYTKRNGYGIQFDEDIFISNKENGTWGKPVSISENINTRYNEGTCTISADGRTLIFTSCEQNTFGTCDLFVSYKTGEVWSRPVNLGREINTSSWESQPTLSADGRTLYFISTRPGGKGRRDIWISTKDENDNWTQAINAGPEINTIWDEVSPFIHVNGQTLYFASTGYPGYGGFDLYYTENLDSGWTEPKNLGKPLNSFNDEVSLFITPSGESGYYSFERRDAEGTQISHLYNFSIEGEIGLTHKSNYVSGRVLDAETMQPLSAVVELNDLAKNSMVSKVRSDQVNGKYLMVLTDGADYALHVSKQGYLFKSLTFNYSVVHDNDPIEIDILLEKPKKGKKVVLNNIYFDFDSYELRDKSKTELKKIYDFLVQNKTVQIEIGGHTDDRGTTAYNQELSRNRAQEVYNYLISQGANPEQLKFKGYGMTEPLMPNDTEANMQLNRRIEFKVI
ncbi:MAG: OmpA family protein [Bacteroidota bacterium]